MSQAVRVLKGSELKHLQSRVARHTQNQLSSNLGQIVKAYQAGKTDQEKEANISSTLGKIHSSAYPMQSGDSKTGPATSQTQATPSAPFSDKPAESLTGD
jgi:hypothetical protein